MLGLSGMSEESELVVADPFDMDGDSPYQESSAIKKWVAKVCVCEAKAPEGLVMGRTLLQ